MAFTAKDVQALRERTSCGMMDCKKALTEADGDMEKAVEILREKGLAAVAKKASRVAADGVVLAIVDEAKKIGACVEVNSETDFVAKNEGFMTFVETVAKTVIDQNPKNVEALLECKAAGTEETIADLLREKVLTIGENILIRRFVRYEGDMVTYIHGGGRIGVMVKFDTDLGAKDEFKAYAKDVAMQIAAVSPLYLDRNAVPAEEIEKEKEILTVQAMNEGKPKEIAEKMVVGRISKYYTMNCLVDQAFVKDDKLTVQQYTDNTAKELGGKIKIVEFVRFEKGEGIEKKEDNFADEVASMMK